MITAKKTLILTLFVAGIGFSTSSAFGQNEYGREAWMATYRTAVAASPYRNSSSGVHRATFNYALAANQNVVNAIDRPTRTNWYYATLWSYYSYYYALQAYNQDMRQGYYLAPPRSARVRDEAWRAFLACLHHYQNG